MRRRLAGCGVVVGVVASCVAVAGPAFGAADIEPFTSSTPISGLIDDTCAGAGVVGIFTGTETVERKSVSTPTGAHFTGTDTTVFRVDFPDGSFLLASQTSPLSFTSARADSVTTFGSTLHERGTLYDANRRDIRAARRWPCGVSWVHPRIGRKRRRAHRTNG